MNDRRKGNQGRRVKHPELTKLRREAAQLEHRVRSQRSEVLKRYARTNVDGVPITCPVALNSSSHGQKRKVIYDTAEQANSAAVELARLGSPRMESYPCRGGEHFHLGGG